MRFGAFHGKLIGLLDFFDHGWDDDLLFYWTMMIYMMSMYSNGPTAMFGSFFLTIQKFRVCFDTF